MEGPVFEKRTKKYAFSLDKRVSVAYLCNLTRNLKEHKSHGRPSETIVP